MLRFIGVYDYTVILTYMSVFSAVVGMIFTADGRFTAAVLCLMFSGLCDAFDVKPYSNKFYRIFDKFIENMTAHRQNTLLLPAFTPALDTAIGEERMNVQLVEIERTEDGWSFGFEKMRRFVRHAKKCGVEIFEHCHLFSQWGAKCSPKIMATVDGEYKKIFGWETDAHSEEYGKFLNEFFCFIICLISSSFAAFSIVNLLYLLTFFLQIMYSKIHH